MPSTAIHRTNASTGDAQKCTISFWFKRGRCEHEQAMVASYRGSTTRWQIRFKSDDTMDVEWGYSNSWYSLITTRKFRDSSAWYHCVVAVDSTQATAANRTKLYINGVQETAFGTENYIPQNNDTLMTSASDEQIIGANGSISSLGNFYDGYLALVQLVDGAQLAATTFGTLDSSSGVWKPKTAAYSTPGTNGYFMKMENSANMDLDSSSNAHTFTTVGTGLTQTKDNPSNNFPVLNRMLSAQGTNYYTLSSAELDGGNLGSKNGTNDKSFPATIAVHKGKWYWEIKLIGNSNTRNIGIVRSDLRPDGNGNIYNGTNTSNGTVNTMNFNPRGSVANVIITDKNDSGSETSSMPSSDSDAIVGCFLDMDNGKMAWHLNGTLINSGNSFSIPDWADGDWTELGAFPSARQDHNQVGYWNFGNGYFGSTAVASAEADEGGIGAFEYNPTATIDGSSQDFRAICTTNIKTYG